jgi:hypothetical protein
MNPCIVDDSVQISTVCSFLIKFIIPKFTEGSNFGIINSITKAASCWCFYWVNDLIIVSSTCFQHPSGHPQENLYMRFYGIFSYIHISRHAAGGAVGWGTTLQAGRSRVRYPMVSLKFFHWHNPSGRTMALGSSQALRKISTRNISWG